MSRNVVDYENLMDTSFSDNNKSILRGVQPRWERKKLTGEQGKKPSDAMSKSKSSKDRHHKPLGPHNTGGSSSTISSSITSSTSSAGPVLQGDRFIPNRGSMNMELSQHLVRSSSMMTTSSANTSYCEYNDESNANMSMEQLTAELDSKAVSDVTKTRYTSSLSNCMFGVEDIQSTRILSYQDKAPLPKGDTVNNLNILYSASAPANMKKSNAKLVDRVLPSAPFRILDAPDLMDDYYCNLLSWSADNILAVALGQTVYLWNAESGDIQELCSLEGTTTHISSVAWVEQGGSFLAVGTSCAKTQLWDVQQGKMLRSMNGHTDRVNALAWNRHILSSASRDTTVVNHDVRVERHLVGAMRAHTQEVCSLKWSLDGETLASGGNDNLLCLWDASQSASTNQQPRFRITDHQAAVKALAWSPHESHLLASGGGTADRTIKFWNTQTGSLLNSVDTGSQVCSLLWNPFERELLSSHGFSRNQLALWKYPSMAKIKQFEGHTSRVLHMAVSPDGSTVVSAAGDETLRFWNVFAAPTKHKTSSTAADAASFANTRSKTSWTAQIR
jgi:cell division cycle protein 20 (cofactor of APC complex)